MGTYIQYTLDDGSTLLVEADEATDGAIKAADASGNIIVQAKNRFAEALSSVKQSVMIFNQELSALETDELEVTFGLKTVGELGLFAVCKASAEVNYTVTLTWKKPV